MQSLGGAEQSGIRLWWCHRCGTLKSARGTHEETEAPKLVKRCREFERLMGDHCTARDYVFLKAFWNSLYLAESINVPADRRPT